MKRAILIFFLLSQCLTVAFAGESSGWGTIDVLNIREDGSMMRIEFSNTIVNPSDCGSSDAYIIDLDNTEKTSLFLSSVLAAFISKKQVQFWIDGCSNTYWGKTYPTVYDIYIKS